MNIAINGFGRIGRAVFKTSLDKKNIKIVAINDLSDTQILAHLIKYDSCYGKYKKGVSYNKGGVIVDGKNYKVFSEKEPENLPWQALKVDIVLECTGRFTERGKAEAHLQAGAKKVIISAPAKGENIKTIILSVNENDLKKEDKIVSMASCTTNCLAPVVKIVKDSFGIKKAIMTTVHSYTADQNLVDGSHKDYRRARAAGVNIVPTTTGAAMATTRAIPELEGKFDGLSIRVPTPIVSLSDMVFLTEKKVSREKVNQAFKEAASNHFKGIVSVTEEALVSSDFIGNPASAIIDLALTKVIDGDLLKTVAWYDNEWGYSCRLAELCEYISKNHLI